MFGARSCRWTAESPRWIDTIGPEDADGKATAIVRWPIASRASHECGREARGRNTFLEQARCSDRCDRSESMRGRQARRGDRPCPPGSPQAVRRRSSGTIPMPRSTHGTIPPISGRARGPGSESSVLAAASSIASSDPEADCSRASLPKRRLAVMHADLGATPCSARIAEKSSSTEHPRERRSAFAGVCVSAAISESISRDGGGFPQVQRDRGWPPPPARERW